MLVCFNLGFTTLSAKLLGLKGRAVRLLEGLHVVLPLLVALVVLALLGAILVELEVVAPELGLLVLPLLLLGLVLLLLLVGLVLGLGGGAGLLDGGVEGLGVGVQLLRLLLLGGPRVHGPGGRGVRERVDVDRLDARKLDLDLVLVLQALDPAALERREGATDLGVRLGGLELEELDLFDREEAELLDLRLLDDVGGLERDLEHGVVVRDRGRHARHALASRQPDGGVLER